MADDFELEEWAREELAAEFAITMLRVQRAIAADREAERAPELRRRDALNARNRRYRRNMRRAVDARRLIRAAERLGVL